MRWAGVFVAAIAVTLPGAACGGSAAQGALHARRVASGLDSPVYVTASRSEPGKLYVVEQPGVIRVLVNGKVQSQPFLDIHNMVKSGGEQGLLSVAFHPSYAKNHRFFVYFNDTSGDVRVYEFRSNGAVGLPGNGQVAPARPTPGVRQPQRRPAAVRSGRAALRGHRRRRLGRRSAQPVAEPQLASRASSCA